MKYLVMVRKKVKDSKVDTELVYAYARTSQLGPLEEFISGTHQANLQSVGDRCATLSPRFRRPSSFYGNRRINRHPSCVSAGTVHAILPDEHFDSNIYTRWTL